jgi:hypothetical protein
LTPEAALRYRQIKGLREAHDDHRYAATLEKLVAKKPGTRSDLDRGRVPPDARRTVGGPRPECLPAAPRRRLVLGSFGENCNGRDKRLSCAAIPTTPIKSGSARKLQRSM